MDAPVWERFADVVLAADAVVCRVVQGVPPRDFAGLYVGDDEVDALLATLPGLDGPSPERVAPVRARLDPHVAAARAALHAWVRTGDDDLARACRYAGVRGVAAEVLAVLLAVDLHPQRQRLLAYVQDSVQLPRPTLAWVARVLGDDGVRALAPRGPLVRAGLVVVGAEGAWATRMCGVAPRVAWAARGDDALDPDVPAGTRALPAPPEGAQAAGAGRGGGRRAPRPPGDRPPGAGALLLVHGADPESRRQAAASVLRGAGLLVTPLPTSGEAWDALVREATLRSVALVVEVDGRLTPDDTERLDRSPHLALVLASARELPLDCLPARPWREVHVRDGEADDADWQARTGSPAPAGVRLTREQLRLVAGADAGASGRAGAGGVVAGVRRLAGGHLDGVAARVHARRGWDDLVLPVAPTDQLRDLVARYRQRRTVFGTWGFPAVPSAGVVALFAGPSGTGKTLAAEVVAADLGLDLYKVDLSAVVSKYIGETEKNLERVFSAAASGDMVLFFDEADALFGKRTDVSSSHDRYANIEVAYLLQRLEVFDGLVVLATNLQGNIDDAFWRRIAVSVTFASPDEAERRRIWERVFPSAAPVEDVDLDLLARRFKVTGGVIRNAALGAAFAAADEGAGITMGRVVRALQRELVKLGHLSVVDPVDEPAGGPVVRAGG
ncbi:ATP-binding protein [Cellulomonas sp. Sa3CUA2]|uniref:ATP-binding protein n=1 Tax=Cellulomonas avistercoris TaxID=2762242 RepID=A0ABR8QDR9_9CELL|nr:ATP-binding protein [Cellulomonas avistercoris]MBD7918576.1 ATP-binding protein [Cellulomonas avistercoris]